MPLTTTIEGTLKRGRLLIAAKRAFKHGEFEEMIERDLPIAASTAQRLMKIARDPRLAKAARAQLLPRAWTTSYELSKLSNEAFDEAVTAGAIHPEMMRRDAQYLVGRVTYEDIEYQVPPSWLNCRVLPITSKAVPASAIVRTSHNAPAVIAPTTRWQSYLDQIEGPIAEMKELVERGDKMDAASLERVRIAGAQLLTIADSCQRSGEPTKAA